MNGQCALTMTWVDFAAALPNHAWWMAAAFFTLILFLMYRMWKYEHVHPECPTEAQQKMDDARGFAMAGLMLLAVLGLPLYFIMIWGGQRSLGIICSTFM